MVEIYLFQYAKVFLVVVHFETQNRSEIFLVVQKIYLYFFFYLFTIFDSKIIYKNLQENVVLTFFHFNFVCWC